MSWQQSALALILVLAVSLLGGQAARVTAANARLALPGDSLYPLKRAIEQWTVLTTADPLARAHEHIDLLKTRENEIVSLIMAGRYEDLPAAVDAFRAEIDGCAVAFRGVAERDQAAALVLVQQTELDLNNNAQRLSILALGGPANARPLIQPAIAASLAGVGILRAQLPGPARTILEETAAPPTLPAIAITALLTSTPTPSPTITPAATAVSSAQMTLTGTASATSVGGQGAGVTTPGATGSATPPSGAPSATGPAGLPPGPTASAPAPGATSTTGPAATVGPVTSPTVPPSPSVPPRATFFIPPSATAQPTATPTRPPAPTATLRPTIPPSPTSQPTATPTPPPAPTNTSVPTDTPAAIPNRR